MQFPDALRIDLLDEARYQDYLADPSRFAADLQPAPLGSWVVGDEIQRLPNLLNKVHRHIEDRRLNCALLGSSARNRLASRCWITEFDLAVMGMIPVFRRSRSTLRLLKRATASTSKPVNVQRKSSRLLRIVRQLSLGWKPSRHSFSKIHRSSSYAPYESLPRLPPSTATRRPRCRRLPALWNEPSGVLWRATPFLNPQVSISTYTNT